MEEMNQTVAEGAVTKKDLRRLFLRSWTIMCSWNYERQMHMGFMFGMAPILDKLYKNKPEKCREAYQRHMEFFNCTPQVTGFIMGLAASMEEQNAKCEDGSFQPESISMIKTSLMGPFAGIGDSFFQGTLRIITFGIGLSFAQQGNVLGPILAVLLFAIPSIIMGYYGTVLGYQSGNKYLTKLYQEGIMERVMQCASIVGLAVVGGMVASMVSINENGIGGFKEVVAMVTGKGAYSKLKYESGVHRVQRVPETESGGRIHTSTATVAVMPEAEEVDVQIDMNDCRIDVMRASGNGGQCVNTTDSAVRLTHMPTGIVIYSQTEKSQLQNKEKAFRLLRSKLYDLELEKRQNSEAEERRSQIGTGDRSEKIRTYNFPQGRVTDHRIKLTLYKIDSIMNGDIQELLDNLIAADQAAKLAKMNEN